MTKQMSPSSRERLPSNMVPSLPGGDNNKSKRKAEVPLPTAKVSATVFASKKAKKKRKKKHAPLVSSRALRAPPVAASSLKRKNQSKQQNSQSSQTDDGDTAGFRSTAESLKLIAHYHTLNKRLEQNARDDTISDEKRAETAKALVKEQQDLGGIERYQQASMFGAKSSKFVCAQWVEPLLRSKLIPPPPNDNVSIAAANKSASKSKLRPRILDVGAIDNQYIQYNWFDAVAIDLNAQHPSVVKADFFDYAHQHCQDAQERPFDAIVLSLVLNFQGDPRKRGDMIALAADTRLLRPNGLVFVALPSASLDNSRYCDEDRFVQVAMALGLDVIEVKRSAKLTLMTFCRDPDRSKKVHYNVATKTFDYGDKEMGRTPATPGAQRNNFAVMLKTSTVAR